MKTKKNKKTKLSKSKKIVFSRQNKKASSHSPLKKAYDKKSPFKKVAPPPQEPVVERLSVFDLEEALQQSFPEDVLAEVAKVPRLLHAKVIEKEIRLGRKDLRSLPTFTIDGSDAKDLDDALSIEKTEQGFTLWVHIADVSHYVKERTALDEEAFSRTTSVYLPQKVIPMLPPELSNGLCSLHPKNNRLTFTVQLFLNEKGHVYDGEVYESIIRSDVRMDYQTVYEILEKKKKCPLAYKPFLKELEWLKDLTFLRKDIGKKRGVFQFTSKELKVKLDEEGKVLDIYPYETTYANDMIEEAMVLANTFVAQQFAEREAPFLYRVHETPNLEKCMDFFKVAHRLGVDLKFESPKNQKYWASLSHRFQNEFAKEGDFSYQVLNLLLLRTMAKARYAPDCLGHYGLGLSHYSHFTSPIRRYPDLFIHRVIKHYIHHKGFKSSWYGRSEKAAEKCSLGEKRAVSLERLAVDFKCAEYMKQHVGDIFEAKVVGFCPAGCFLALENGIEGLLPFSAFPVYMVYDEMYMEAYSRGGAVVLNIGTSLEVQVVRVDDSKAHIDFALTEEALKEMKLSKAQKRQAFTNRKALRKNERRRR